MIRTLVQYSCRPGLGVRAVTIVGTKYFTGASDVVFNRVSYTVKHEKDNPKDPNAVVVTTANKTIGYLRKNVASLLASHLDDKRLRVKAVVHGTSEYGTALEYLEAHCTGSGRLRLTPLEEVTPVQSGIRKTPSLASNVRKNIAVPSCVGAK